MSQILILSNSNAFFDLCSSALSANYQVGFINNIKEITDDTDALIIDSIKIEQNHNLFSIFNNKKPRVLIMGKNWSEDKQIRALVNGAAGYCSLSEPPKLLLQAMESILNGDIWIKRHLVPKIIGTLIQVKSVPVEEINTTNSDESAKLIKTLTNRELDVAKMIRTGESNKKIASKLHISERTVKAHLTSIFKKLNISDRLHLALFIQEINY